MKTTIEAMRNWFRAELEKCGNSAAPETPLYWRRQALEEASRQVEKMEARQVIVETHPAGEINVSDIQWAITA